jgi:hypothetical protein
VLNALLCPRWNVLSSTRRQINRGFAAGCICAPQLRGDSSGIVFRRSRSTFEDVRNAFRRTCAAGVSDPGYSYHSLITSH